MAYPRLHLLGIPAETRINIWRHIYSDILNDSEGQTYEQRASCWNGLTATSSIIHEEVSELWPRTMIPYHKNDRDRALYHRVTNLVSGISGSLYRSFRHLAMELPIRPERNGRQFYRQVAAGLQQLAPVLQELRIHFIGQDNFEAQTNYLGCGLGEYPDLSEFRSALPKEGLCHGERGVLIRALQDLICLRRLVLSNVNYPFLQSLIGTKPWLESLQLTSDPRSPMCKPVGVLLHQWRRPIALKALAVSANAVFGAVNMVSCVLETLQSLTFLVPSTHWQPRGNWKWLDEIGVLVRNIGQWGQHLRQFRFCIEQQLSEATAAAFLGSIKLNLPWTKLEVLEIHATLYSDYFGAELVDALPVTLKRLYISQELIHVDDLVESIKARYFASPDTMRSLNAGALGFVSYAFWERESTKLSLLRMNAGLLDRERNMHLLQESEAESHHFGGSVAGFPVTKRSLQPLRVTDLGEDAMSNEYAPEEALIYYQDTTREHVTIAEMVFLAEKPARAGDRIHSLVMPDLAPVGQNDHWMTDSETERRYGSAWN